MLSSSGQKLLVKQTKCPVSVRCPQCLPQHPPPASTPCARSAALCDVCARGSNLRFRSSSTSSKSSQGNFGGASIAIRAVDSIFEDPDLDFLDAPSPVIPRHVPISPPVWGGGGYVGSDAVVAPPMGQRSAKTFYLLRGVTFCHPFSGLFILVKTFNPNLLPHSDQAAVAPLNLRELFISPSIANGRAARSSLQEHTSRRCSRLHQ